MNRDADSNRVLIGIIGGAALIVLTMITAVFLVSRRPIVVVVPAGGALSGGPMAPALPTSSSSATAATASKPIPEIAISKVATAPGVDNPFDPIWEKIAVVEVDLAPQQVAQPVLEQVSIVKLRVQAAHDDERYIWRLNWDQPQPIDRSEVASFSDAIAMQFPLVDNAPYTMGGPGLPVRMLYWKAIWQKDVDQGFQGNEKLYPNSEADLYWFAEGKEPHSASGSINNPAAKQWMIAAQSENPMVDFERKHPIEELTAHGFGSGTHVAQTPSRGRGVWRDGQWFVTIDRPIDLDDPLIQRFRNNPVKQMMAFAVWDGKGNNRGGRKQITNWLPMRIAL